MYSEGVAQRNSDILIGQPRQSKGGFQRKLEKKIAFKIIDIFISNN